MNECETIENIAFLILKAMLSRTNSHSLTLPFLSSLFTVDSASNNTLLSGVGKEVIRTEGIHAEFEKSL